MGFDRERLGIGYLDFGWDYGVEEGRVWGDLVRESGYGEDLEVLMEEVLIGKNLGFV